MNTGSRSQIHIINYKTRLLFELLLGFIFYLVVTKTLLKEYPASWEGFIYSLSVFVVISEGIFTCNKVLSKRYTWHQHTVKRLVFLLIFTFIWYILVSLLSFIFKPVIEGGITISRTVFFTSLVMSILFVTIYVVLLIAYNYHQSLSAFILENEKLKSEKLRLDYIALQDQVNPHFLFNNLSTLIAIIRQDQKSAIRFAENFSDVYRYVLKSKDCIAVSLKEEMTFVESYFQLHKERLRDGVQLSIDIAEDLMDKRLPVLSVQFLVENAIKHNVATLAKPLQIEITGAKDSIVVKNNLNPKTSTYSTNTGLPNLQKRITFLTDRPMKVSRLENEFVVELPLIG